MANSIVSNRNGSSRVSSDTHIIKLSNQPKDNRTNKTSSVLKAYKSLKKPDLFISLIKARQRDIAQIKQFYKSALLFFHYFQEDSKYRQCFDNKDKDVFLLSKAMCLAPSTCLQYIERMTEVSGIIKEWEQRENLKTQQDAKVESECKSDDISALKMYLNNGGVLTEKQMANAFVQIDKPREEELYLDACIDLVKTMAKELDKRLAWIDGPSADYNLPCNMQALWVLFYALRKCESFIVPWLNDDDDLRHEIRDSEKNWFCKKNENNMKKKGI
jgi:hypothetical protein